MGLLDRFRRRRPEAAPGGGGRSPDRDDEAHLRSFATSREGVEGFVEPRTTVTDTTFLLVASDGEWTRRKVPSAEWAYKWAGKLGIPSYDAAVTGLPSRMREYNRRQKEAEKQRLQQFLDGPDDGRAADEGPDNRPGQGPGDPGRPDA